MSGCRLRICRYTARNHSESGWPLSISMACASVIGAGTSSSTLRIGLYHLIVGLIGAPLLRGELTLSPSLRACHAFGVCAASSATAIRDAGGGMSVVVRGAGLRN